MKLLKSLLLLAAWQATTASAALDINADPNLTGAAPLPSFLTGQQSSQVQSSDGFDNTPRPVAPAMMSRMFGAQLFNGTSADSGATVGFNPGYVLNPGDSIQVRLWGAFTFDGALQVDPKGNIFLPNVGPVKVAGVSNSQLNALVTSKVKEVYQANVSVYASLLQAQPVKVYVTGFVRSPGLYGGVTSDSLLNYLIKAGGVDPDRGSYVDIVVKRGNRVRSSINLYDFLLNGKLGLSQFADGDTIVVGPRQHTFSVQGDVFNSYDFEFRDSSIPVTEALSWARAKPGATNITIIRQQGLQKRSEYYPISSAPGRMLQDGDTLIVSTDRYAGTIQVRVEGAHSGEHAMVLPYGSSMRAVLAKIRTNSMSEMSAIQLYRPSVAQRQKEMLDLSLQKLEEASLSAQSSTKEEASLRMQEAQLISRFVNKARNVVPKGEVILNEKNLDSILLEDGDVINIPQKTSLVMVHGEVLFPNAVSWEKGMSPKDYIEKCGGLTQKSGNAKIVVIRQNGAAENGEDVDTLNPGDELMVLPKYESKNIEVTRGISTILYQLAVGAKVILSI
ncbi:MULTISPECIES: polysaccharide biosynthesis/export family protein [unclassified Pantoea]|jgi:Periplasmic protein involved in polysaccharide export|uniref:polysaccharide biosynthesis/export family protein n=1 Tax=unclassified Pantoea TaxID=2630326 RepID=UPI000BC9ED0E|nr:polysaccharide biosynthesis/export family protein [Pantoea sp. GL120224-02]SNY65966.1 protein involved in polysaccharide export, contains SLBB domain of the beta-grasp fold [Pantoea sp. GL120224-02]